MVSPLLSLLLSTDFWIIVNAILLSAIIGLVYYRYVTEKKINQLKVKHQPQETGIQNIINQFNIMLEIGEVKEAVITAFNKIMERLGAEEYKEKTYKELLEGRLLNAEPLQYEILNSLYNVYERLRFSDYEPSSDELESFRNNLYRFSNMLRRKPT